MRSWAQGELCSCELLMNAAPLGLVVGRASGGASAVFGLVAAGGSGWGGTVAGGVGREVDGEMASSPAVSEPGGSFAGLEGGCNRSCW